MKYLDKNAEDRESIEQYFTVRCVQAGFNSVLVNKNLDGTYLATFNNNYISLYIPPSLRGKGLIKNYLGYGTIATTPDCEIEEALINVGADYKVFAKWTGFDEYKLISAYYGDKKASRSGRFLMDHISEGAAYMENMLNATDEAIKAFMLHPIFQDNEAYTNHKYLLHDLNPYVVALVMEYRRCANSYLCKPYTDNWTLEDIDNYVQLVDSDVKDMLKADKYQNQKDFLEYHYGTHIRSDELYAYFNKWDKYLWK